MNLVGDGEKAPLRLKFNPKIQLEFRGATITSDAGLLAFRGLDDTLDLTPIASEYLQESRTGRNIQHHLVPLLRQSIYSRLAIDTLGKQFYSSSHTRGSHVQGNRLDLGNTGLRASCFDVTNFAIARGMLANVVSQAP
jgi:hypothetical protein